MNFCEIYKEDKKRERMDKRIFWQEIRRRKFGGLEEIFKRLKNLF